MLSEYLSDLRYRLRALFHRETVDRELEDELRFHLERETEKHVAAGLSRARAERQARLEFGGMSRIKDETRHARGVILIEQVAQYFRYALRCLRLRPLFSVAVV